MYRSVIFLKKIQDCSIKFGKNGVKMTKEELSANVIKTKNLDKVVDDQTLINKKYIYLEIQ